MRVLGILPARPRRAWLRIPAFRLLFTGPARIGESWLGMRWRSLCRPLEAIARTEVLVADDFANARREISGWHRQIGDPTVADSILDRLVRWCITPDSSWPAGREMAQARLRRG
jgi:hypothetical protein